LVIFLKVKGFFELVYFGEFVRLQIYTWECNLHVQGSCTNVVHCQLFCFLHYMVSIVPRHQRYFVNFVSSLILTMPCCCK